MQVRLRFTLFLLFVAGLHQFGNGYTVEVNARAQACFQEESKLGERVHASFSVVSGGFRDIDVKLFGPNGKVLYEEEKSTEDSLTLVAPLDGMWRRK